MSTLSAGHDDHWPYPVRQLVCEQRELQGAIVGAVAGLVASGVMLWAGRAWGGVILPQLLSDRMTGIIPTSLFGQALGALESNAKPLTLAGLTLLQVAIGAVIGWVYARVARRDGMGRLSGAITLSLVTWAMSLFVAAPLGEVGVMARDAPGDLWRTQVVFVVASLLFGVMLAAFVPQPAARPAGDTPDPQR